MIQVDSVLKKTIRFIDLAMAAGRKRQSPKTGFVHGFATDDLALDTIPTYENFCFAFALFRQKTGESILEGKELIEKLLAFQTEDGNFPIYLHDYPKCWDVHLSLKIAPMLIHILREFSSVLKEDFKSKIEKCLQKAIVFPKNPSWEHRFLACKGIRPNQIAPSSPDEWFEWIVSMQLFDQTSAYPIPYHAAFQMFLGNHSVQEKEKVQPVAIEYALAEQQGFSKRLMQDRLHQLHSALLFPLTSSCETYSDVVRKEESPCLFWASDERVNSLCFPQGKWEKENRIVFDLAHPSEIGRGDLFELSMYCNLSEDLAVRINGQRGMIFYLGDVVSIITSTRQIDISFDLLEGNGDFCGHLAQGNRPGQIACKGSHAYDAYDWHIGLRTLRRDYPVKVIAKIDSWTI